MSEKYTLTPKQVVALRALGGRIVESSAAEVAVSGLLVPNEAREALATLEHLGLASSWIPVTALTGEHVFVLNDEGQTVCRALEQFKGSPPVGAMVRIPRPFERFSKMFGGDPSSTYVEIIPEARQAVAT